MRSGPGVTQGGGRDGVVHCLLPSTHHDPTNCSLFQMLCHSTKEKIPAGIPGGKGRGEFPECFFPHKFEKRSSDLNLQNKKKTRKKNAYAQHCCSDPQASTNPGTTYAFLFFSAAVIIIIIINLLRSTRQHPVTLICRRTLNARRHRSGSVNCLMSMPTRDIKHAGRKEKQAAHPHISLPPTHTVQPSFLNERQPRSS